MSRERRSSRHSISEYTNLDGRPLPFGIFCLALVAIVIGFLTIAFVVGWPYAVVLIGVSVFLVVLIVVRQINAHRR